MPNRSIDDWVRLLTSSQGLDQRLALMNVAETGAVQRVALANWAHELIQQGKDPRRTKSQENLLNNEFPILAHIWAMSEAAIAGKAKPHTIASLVRSISDPSFRKEMARQLRRIVDAGEAFGLLVPTNASGSKKLIKTTGRLTNLMRGVFEAKLYFSAQVTSQNPNSDQNLYAQRKTDNLNSLPGSRGRHQKEPFSTGEQTEGPLTDERSTNEILNLYLDATEIPESRRAVLAAGIRQMIVRELSDVNPRPKWSTERNNPNSELGALPAPMFLKRVYGDVIGPEGIVYKDIMRDIDSDLMAAIDTYVSQRSARKQDLGYAQGLVFIASRPATNARALRKSRRRTPSPG
jgi:hypothetical protein